MLLVKLEVHRAASRFLSFVISLILKPLGYGKPSQQSHPVPQSSYYKNVRALNVFIGLHGIPSNQNWLESKVANLSIKGGELVPWITYPSLSFLEKIDFTDLSCVEFGSGASTFWFASRCKEFVSFEFDSDYFNLLSKTSTSEFTNVTDASWLLYYCMKADHIQGQLRLCIEYDLDHLNIKDAHLIEVTEFSGGSMITKIRKKIETADIVFIDGGPRNFLIALAAHHLKSNALLVIDNTDQDYVQLGLQVLKGEGFREIPFTGIGPLNPYEWQTSIFIKSLEPLDFLR